MTPTSNTRLYLHTSSSLYQHYYANVPHLWEQLSTPATQAAGGHGREKRRRRRGGGVPFPPEFSQQLIIVIVILRSSYFQAFCGPQKQPEQHQNLSQTPPLRGHNSPPHPTSFPLPAKIVEGLCVRGGLILALFDFRGYLGVGYRENLGPA